MSNAPDVSPTVSIAVKNNSKQLLSSIEELSDEIELFGLRRLPKYKSLEGQSGLDQNKLVCMLKSVIHAAFSMIQYHRRMVQEHEEADEKKQRFIDDSNSLKATTERQRMDLGERDRLLNIAAEQDRRLKVKLDGALSDLKVQKEEVRRLKSQLKHREDQSIHEMRKKEQEIVRLQTQLSQAIKTGSLRRPPKKPPTDGEVQARKEAEEKDLLYKRVICKFEDNNQSVMRENLTLVDTLYKLNADLGMLVDDYNGLMNVCFKTHKTHEGNPKKEELQTPQQHSYKDPYDLSLKECKTMMKYFWSNVPVLKSSEETKGCLFVKHNCHIFILLLKDIGNEFQWYFPCYFMNKTLLMYILKVIA